MVGKEKPGKKAGGAAHQVSGKDPRSKGFFISQP
jgi:hypothetical protein